jgi:rare lipoprotein A
MTTKARLCAVALACLLGGTAAEAKPCSHDCASFYGSGKKTASGERFDRNAMTAAHRSLPFGTLVRVVNRRNGKSVSVRVNDRGPFRRSRVIDLTPATFDKIATRKAGVVAVRLEVGETASTIRRLIAKLDRLSTARREIVRGPDDDRHRLSRASVGTDARDATERMREIIAEIAAEARQHASVQALSLVEIHAHEPRSLVADAVQEVVKPLGIVRNIFRSFFESLVQPAGSHVRMTCADGEPFPEPLRRLLARAGDHFASTVYVLSGYRPLAYNRRIYGNRRGKKGRYRGDGSQHILCRAADIRVAGISAGQVYAWALTQPEVGGLGRYRDNFIHIDIRNRVRSKIVMWDWRKKRTRYAYRKQHRG